MEQSSLRLLQSPVFGNNQTVNGRSFSLGKQLESKLKRIQGPFIASPLNLEAHLIYELSKDSSRYTNSNSHRNNNSNSYGNNTGNSHQYHNRGSTTNITFNNFISPTEKKKLVFKDFRLSPMRNQSTDSFFSPKNFSSSNLKESPVVLVSQLKSGPIILSEHTIKEEVNEETIEKNAQILNNNTPYSYLRQQAAMKQNRRMMIEMIKVSNDNNRLIENYDIDTYDLIPKSFNGFFTNRSSNSTRSSDEDFDDTIQLFCFLSIPRIIRLNNDKRMMFITPMITNKESYCLIFRNYITYEVIDQLDIKSIMKCHRKNHCLFEIHFAKKKTYHSNIYQIEVDTPETCVKYVLGIKILSQTTFHY